MWAIDNNTASTTYPPKKPVGPPGFFTAGTVGGVPATIVEADFLNITQTELLNILAAAGITPDKTVDNQVVAAILALIHNNTRLRLNGPLDLYVNATTGSDTNNGLTPTTAWATPQAAWNYIISRLDVGGNNVTVHIADGTYPGFSCNGYPVGSQGNQVIFQGDIVNPAAVVISEMNNSAINVADGAVVTLQGMRVQTGGVSALGHGIAANPGSNVIWKNVDFGPCTYAHVGCAGLGVCGSWGNPYSISGGAQLHIFSSAGNIATAGSAVTINNNPHFSGAFCASSGPSLIGAWSMTFTGPATGVRWSAGANGVIDIEGANPDTFFPGDQVGSAAKGGQVV